MFDWFDRESQMEDDLKCFARVSEVGFKNLGFFSK